MKRGFTLIELVMVIVVLGILAIIAIPKFLSVRDRAARGRAQGMIGAIRSCVSMYYSQQTITGAGTYPPVITGGMFADGQMPSFVAPYSYTYDSSNGSVTLTSS